MAVRVLSSNYEEEIRIKLKKLDCPARLLLIYNFAFLTVIQHLMQDLDSKFQGKRGPKAYPRVLLLITVLYCFSENINTKDKIVWKNYFKRKRKK